MRRPSTLFRGIVLASSTLFGMSALAQQSSVMLSHRAKADFAPSANPDAAVWKGAKGVIAAADRFGRPLPEARTEIRSLWTPQNLYFLFVSNYETLYPRPNPTPEKEAWGLWEYDVVEVFIGHDLSNIHLYKEFEISPDGEFIDLDVDNQRQGQKVDWMWNSGMAYKTRIDRDRKVWICEMQIPWKAIDTRTPAAGNELRLNLYRIEGGPKDRKYIAWQPVHNPSYHTPEKFGRLRLVD